MSLLNHNTIYLIRHGENRANVTHEFSYKYVDYSLTEKGVLQAEQTADYFRAKRLDAVYASPLKRAKETAEIIARPHGLAVILLEYFREVNVGSLEGQPPTDENWAVHNRIVEEWFAGNYDEAFPDGENYHMLLARMRAGLFEVTRERDGQQIAIVGHGGIFTRTLRDICPTADLNVAMSKQNHNCAISKIELTTDLSTGQVSGVLDFWASIEHLHGKAADVLPGTVLPGKQPLTKQA